jgi:hypothetical protein
LFCYYFLRKKIIVNSEAQNLEYHPIFKRAIVIDFASIDKIDENQHGFTLYMNNVSKKIFSIGHSCIGYDLLKAVLKNNHIKFSYKEVGYGKSF